MEQKKALVLLVSLVAQSVTVSHCQTDEYVTVDTPQGTLRGLSKNARNGDTFSAFYGVPFARPPLGDLRWQPPQPSPSWDGVLDATKEADECYQNDLYSPQKAVGSEDCLYVNVFTKTAAADTKKQVMVWFHGGAFIFGGGQLYKPDYFMEENIVLVVVQYRLNVFGFLSTEDSAAPGNYGSLDQVQALKWIQANIESFGGDPSKVTLVGMSAGGASVHYLTLSPLTRGLYKNAISLSGSALCWWANIPNPKEKALKLADKFTCAKSDNSKAMLDCLRKVPGHKIMTAHHTEYFDWHIDSVEREPMNVFSPRADPEAGPGALLPEHPYVAMLNGHINPQPHMIGFTDKEGIWRANQILPDDSDASKVTWKDFAANITKVAPLALGLFGGQTKNPDEVTQKVLEFYGLDRLNEHDQVTDEVAHKVIDVLSDSMFSYAVDKAAQMRAEHKHLTTYYHYFTFSGTHSLANLAIDHSIRRPPLVPLRRASHGADMLQMFPMFPFDKMPDYELEFSRKYVKFLIEWGKDGKPPQWLSDWKPFDVKDPSYLQIDREFVVRKGIPDHERLKFWAEDLPPVYWNFVLSQRKSSDKEEL